MSPDIYKNKKMRLLIGIGLPLAAFCLAAFCYITKKTPPCVFYNVTGLYCAGCGSGRSLLALLHGDFYASFRYQPLMFISLPFICYYIGKVYLAFVLGRDVLPAPKIKTKWFGITIIVLVVVFGVLRNIPIAPFTYLAPYVV